MKDRTDDELGWVSLLLIVILVEIFNFLSFFSSLWNHMRKKKEKQNGSANQ